MGFAAAGCWGHSSSWHSFGGGTTGSGGAGGEEALRQREEALRRQLWDLEDQIWREGLPDGPREAIEAGRRQQAEIRREARRRLGLPEEES